MWYPDTCLPKKHFNQGVSNVSHITGGEYIPLAWQLPVVLGVEPDRVAGGEILPWAVRKKAVKLFHGLASVREALWLKEHSQTAVDLLQQRVVSVMKLMKETFLEQSLCGFRFVKFHMSLHLTECIERFGSLRFTDSGPGERQHKQVVKPAFRRTSKKNKQVAAELAVEINTSHKLNMLVMRHDISVEPAQASAPRVASDGFSGECCTLRELRYTQEISNTANLPVQDLATHFKRGLVPLLLMETGDCSYVSATTNPPKSAVGRALRRSFYDMFQPPVLFKSFTIQVGDSSTTFRAHRNFHKLPWYDFVCCSVDEGDMGTNMYAARALTFVSLTKKGRGGGGAK